jgi:large subunit ribosomal protein L21
MNFIRLNFECSNTELTMKIGIPRVQTLVNLAAGLVMMLFDEAVSTVDGQTGANGQAADDLTQISGIGPAYARRLNEAGVTTYSQLSALSPEQVRELVQLGEWQGEPEEWIEQAWGLTD